MNDTVATFLHGVWAHPCRSGAERHEGYRLSGKRDVAYSRTCSLSRHVELVGDELRAHADGAVMVNAVPVVGSVRLAPTDEVTLLEGGVERERFVFAIEVAENYAARKKMTP